MIDHLFKKSVLAAAMAASALAATPALANHDRGYRRYDDTGTAVAVAAVGLLAIAVLASSHNNRDRRCDGDRDDDRRCYYRNQNQRGYYSNGYDQGGYDNQGYDRGGYYSDGEYDGNDRDHDFGRRHHRDPDDDDD